MTSHENIIIKYATITSNKLKEGVIEIGKELSLLGIDKIVDGGFWIWDIISNKEYYSNNFISSLGYEEKEFPFVSETWQKHIHKDDLLLAFSNYEKHLATGGEHPYQQRVRYNKKNGEILSVICSGTIIRDKNNNPAVMIGSHKLI